MNVICFSQNRLQWWLHFTGDVNIGLFIVFWCDVSSRFCVPKITKIGYFFTQLFFKWRCHRFFETRCITKWLQKMTIGFSFWHFTSSVKLCMTILLLDTSGKWTYQQVRLQRSILLRLFNDYRASHSCLVQTVVCVVSVYRPIFS